MLRNQNGVAVLVLGLWAAVCLPTAAAQPSKGRDQGARLEPTHADVRYGPHERNVLDLYLAKSDRPTPLVLYIHGGGFRGGDKRTLSPAGARAYLAAGFSIAAINDRVIGLTIVAVGTSLPELATSIVGAYRGEADIVVGNVLGSNIFNVLCIMGLVTQVRPLAVQAQSLWFDLPVMAAFAVALVPIMRRGLNITRVEGAVLVVAYGGFLVWQVCR